MDTKEGVDTTSRKIIEAAALSFTRKGYFGSSLDEIAKNCEIKKQSILYHFANKKSLALAVVDAAHRSCREELFVYAFHPDIDQQQKIHCFLVALQRLRKRALGLHVMSAFAHELLVDDVEFKAPVHAYYEDWLQAICKLLDPFYDKNEALLVAQRSMVQIHGSFGVHYLFSGDDYFQQSLFCLEQWWSPAQNK